jgi:hypothetical protein
MKCCKQLSVAIRVKCTELLYIVADLKHYNRVLEIVRNV